MTDRELSGHGVAAPAERCKDKIQIGSVQQDLSPDCRRQANTRLAGNTGWYLCLSRKNLNLFINRSLSSCQGIIDARVCGASDPFRARASRRRIGIGIDVFSIPFEKSDRPPSEGQEAK
jgi:hypothetical protein